MLIRAKSEGRRLTSTLFISKTRNIGHQMCLYILQGRGCKNVPPMSFVILQVTIIDTFSKGDDVKQEVIIELLRRRY